MAVRQMLVAGRYRLVEPVGAGGMGRVWLARDEMLDRDVAIKEIVPPDWMTEAEKDRLRDRTLREARSAARLNHPHVVRIYDVVHHDGQSWIVMEYVRSRSLHQVLQEEGPYDPAGAARIGLAVLDALDSAHRAGVLHRDVKPHNVLIGADGRVVLTDFGLATFVDDGTVTAPGLIVGSPQYVSPERARDGASTVESDLWSLGATVYAAVEGRSPYARETAMATLAALATEPPDPPVRAGPLTPVLDGLLRFDPATRLSATEVESRLRVIVAIDHREVPLVPGQRGVRHRRPEEPRKPADGAVFEHPARDRAPEEPGPPVEPPDPDATPEEPFTGREHAGAEEPDASSGPETGGDPGEEPHPSEAAPAPHDPDAHAGSAVPVGPVLPDGESTEPVGRAYEINPPGPAYEINPPGPAHETDPPGPAHETDPPGPAHETEMTSPAHEIETTGPVGPSGDPADTASDNSIPPDDAVTTPLRQGSRDLVRFVPQPVPALTSPVLERPAPRKLLPKTPARIAALVSVAIVLVGGTVSASYLAQNSRPRPHVVLPSAPGISPSAPAQASTTPSGRSPGVSAEPTGAADPSPGTLPTTPVAEQNGFSSVVCDSPSPPRAPVTPKKGAARGVNGWTLLAGWSYFTDGSGFHIAVPDGWTYQRVGTMYCFRDPGSSLVMSLDTGRDADADPLKACHAEDLRLKSEATVPGYALISITSVPLLHKAADWEFRYQSANGTMRRAGVRWFAVNGRAYAIGWATPEAAWPDHLSKIQMVRSTFYANRPGRGATADADRG